MNRIDHGDDVGVGRAIVASLPDKVGRRVGRRRGRPQSDSVYKGSRTSKGVNEVGRGR